MKLSVVIPTYNRASLIGITLDSLLNQSLNPTDFEIIVSDNNSSDNTKEIISGYVEKSGGRIKYFFEGRQGAHFARNAPALIARGEYLYFTDDDMITDSHCLEELVRFMDSHPDVGTATGRILPHWESRQPSKWLKKYFLNGYLSLYDNSNDSFVSNDDFGVFSCHQIVRKQAFINAGGYNPDIIGKEWIGDNETGLCIKLKDLGWKFGFVRPATTEHIIPERRMTQAYFNRRFACQGNCDTYTDYQREPVSADILRSQCKSYSNRRFIKAIKFLVQFCIGKDKWHVSRAQINYYSARISYNKRLISDPNRREIVLRKNWIDN